MTQDDRIRLGRTLKVLREAARLRQSELATACAVSRQYVHNVEAGEKAISLRLAGVIAAVIAPRIRSTEEDVRALLWPETRGGSYAIR